MSLHALAQHMQEKGRNGDSMLVHMTPGEVHGLQSLAMAHGGSLTINPQTGLPEAGFLSSLLPMIAGFALNAFLPGVGTAIGSALGGLSGAAGTGILVGGATGLATGSLQKGLMAGLGAYGGAGLGTGITETGAQLGSVPQATAGNPAITQIGAPIQEGATSPLMQQIQASKAMIPTNSAVAQSMGLPGGLVPPPTAITPSTTDLLGQGFKNSFGNGMEGLKSLYGNLPTGTLPALGAYALMGGMGNDKNGIAPAQNQGMIRPYTLDRQQNQSAYAPVDANGQRMPIDSRGNPMDSSERMFFNDTFTAGKPYKAPGPEYAADGGLMGLAVGGPAEQQAAFQAIAMNANYPMAHIDLPMYSNPQLSRPMAREVVNPSGDVDVDEFTGEARMAGGGMTAFDSGGVADLGDYSDGGRLLKGPGDGVSDSIPASIGNRQPARLADGEFVVPARIVSEIGNGSTEAGARKLYAMMDRVQHARRKTVGKNQVAKNTKAEKLLPA